MPARCPFAIVAGLVMAVVATPPEAVAFRLRLDARSGVLAYPIIGRDGAVVLDERLIQSRIMLRMDDIIPIDSPWTDPAEEPDVALAASMRWFVNAGVSGASVNPGDLRFIPGLDDTALAILYAYAEATNLVGGRIDARAGRLVHSGPIGWRSDDGAMLILAPAEELAVRLIGGFENVRGLRLSVSPFAPGGVERWAEEGEGAERYGEPREPEHRPMFQMALGGVAGPMGYDLAYRRTWRSLDGGLAQEAAGAAADFAAGPVLVRGSALLDLGMGFVTDAEARATVRLAGGKHRVEALYAYFRPTFDLDSIFLVFASDAFHEATLRYGFPLAGALSGELWGSIRRIEDPQGGGDAEPVAGPFSDAGGGLALRLRLDRVDASVRWKLMRGGATSLAAFDLEGEVALARIWSVFAVGSLWQYEDRMRSEQYGMGGACRAGGAVDIAGDVRVEVEGQIARDAREGTTFAVFAWLDLGVTL